MGRKEPLPQLCTAHGKRLDTSPPSPAASSSSSARCRPYFPTRKGRREEEAEGFTANAWRKCLFESIAGSMGLAYQELLDMEDENRKQR